MYRQVAVTNIKKKQIKDKERYDEKHRHAEYEEGDQIFVLILQSTNAQFTVEVTAGAFWKSLPETISYEASIPLNYESDWSMHDLTELLRTPDMRRFDYNSTDEIETLLPQLENAFYNEFQQSIKTWDPLIGKNISEREIRFKRALDFVGDALSWCCGVATQQKLDSLTLHERDVRRRLNLIERGLSDSIVTLSKNSKKFQEFEQSVRTNLKVTERHMRSVDEILKKVALEDEKTNYIIRKLRESVIRTCSSRRIPISVLPPEVLDQDLTNLNLELSRTGQRLAISELDLARYYELAICDCSFSASKLFLHVKIPVDSAGKQWELFELITTPFAWNNHTCIIPHEVLYLAISNNEVTNVNHLRQISGTRLHNCKPFDDKLCFIPRFSADVLQGPICAQKLYEGTTVDELSKHCSMRCHASVSMIISEIEEEVYVITNPRLNMEIVCENVTRKINNHEAYIGAIKIKLPCSCFIRDKQEIIILQKFPCPKTLPRQAVIRHIIPAAWSNLKSFILHPKKLSLPEFKNLTDCLNQNWTLTIPYTNLTTYKSFQLSIQDAMPTDMFSSYADNYGIHGDSILLIWNLILSIIIVYLFAKRNRNVLLAETRV